MDENEEERERRRTERWLLPATYTSALEFYGSVVSMSQGVWNMITHTHSTAANNDDGIYCVIKGNGDAGT